MVLSSLLHDLDRKEGPHTAGHRVNPLVLPLIVVSAALSTVSKASAETRAEIALLPSWQL